MSKREDLIKALIELVRGGMAVEEALRNYEREIAEAFLGEARRQLEEELMRTFYTIRRPPQPSAEELKGEIAKALGLEEAEDLLDGLRRALRGSEGSRAEQLREGAPEAAGDGETR
ncbi:MAG: hypothetical protein NZ902_05740 [Acidilobaceae archaeon]|nr:hypothetical protein [Acidilobaceae archaeon]MCX8166067.1 hypothetical protein [Acidilobaceae archaeon]MDW7974710.1 hypothetical protein [Sulfolobales archaeon]